MIRGILVIVLSALGIASAEAGTYESRFGFTIDLPSRWHVVNRESLESDPVQADTLKGIDKAVLEKNRQAVLNGQAEIYYDNLHDSIYVQMDSGGMRPHKSLEKQICNKEMLQKAFSKSFGKAVQVYACVVVRVSNYDAVYMDFEGTQPETRSLQYQIWMRANDTVILTLTAGEKHLRKLKDEFTSLIYSFEAVK
jgi:hypothetical protein